MNRDRGQQYLRSLKGRIDLPRHKGVEVQALKPFAIWLCSQGYDVPALRRLSEADMAALKQSYRASTRGGSSDAG